MESPNEKDVNDLLETPPKKFNKRQGTTNHGSKFENLYCAAIALHLIQRNDVKDFELSSNDSDFGSFDDVVLIVKSTTTTQKYAIQLKYSLKSKVLCPAQLDKGDDFNLTAYYKAFLNLQVKDNFKFILATNRKTRTTKPQERNALKDGDTLNLKLENVQIKLRVQLCDQEDLLKNIDQTHSCFKFIADEKNNDCKKYKQFFDNFYLFTDHTNIDKIENDIFEVFKTTFNSDKTVAKKYLEFIENWSSESKQKMKLSASVVKHKLALCIFSPYIKCLTFTETPLNENKKLLREAMTNFEITFLRDENCEKLCNLWNDFKLEHLSNLTDVKNKAWIYQIVPKAAVRVEDMCDEICTLLLWLMGKCPLILRYNEVVRTSMELCHNRKFILLTNNNEFEDSHQNTFKSLFDLRDLPIYTHLLDRFTCSLQGKTKIPLKELIQDNEEIVKIITATELVEMADKPFLIGEKKEPLPTTHITRSLSKNVIDYKILQAIDRHTLVLVSCVEDISVLPAIQTVNLEEFLENKDWDFYKLQSKMKKFICICKTKCLQVQFEKLCTKVGKQITCHQFVHTNEGLEWVRSSGNVGELRQYQTKRYFDKEFELFDGDNFNNVNLVCGPPGLGKTTFLKNLKNVSPVSSWILLIDTKKHLKHFENKQADITQLKKYILDDIFQERKHRRFDSMLFKIMLEEGRILYLWDGLDEINENKVKVVTNVIECLSQHDKSKHLITSRDNLKVYLENHFNVLSRSLKEFDESEQKTYIGKCLNRSSDETEALYEKIKGKIESIQSVDILGIPLMIYILTKLLSKNEDVRVLENIFSLADLYEQFTHYMFDVYWQKIGINDLNNALATHFLEKNEANQLEWYKTVALKLYFAPDFLKKWNAVVDAKKENDHAGFVLSIIDDSFPQFLHNSFGEYFAALYFVQHSDNLVDIEDYYFETKYQNIRYFVDLISSQNCPAHLAVLHKHYDQLEKCSEEELKRTNACGLTPIEMVISWCTKYVCANMEKVDNYCIGDNIILNAVKPEEEINEKILTFLLKMYDHRELKEISLKTRLLFSNNSLCLMPLVFLKYRHGFDIDLPEKYLVTIRLLGVNFDYDEVSDCSPNTSTHLNKQDLNLLHRAAYFGSTKTGAKMMQTYAFRNLSNEEKSSLLFEALEQMHTETKCKHCEFAKQLIENGAPLETRGVDGETPLHQACWAGHYEAVELLIQKGADKEAPGNMQRTPLHYACLNGQTKIAKLLIDHGAGLNATDNEENTPLHVACFNGHYEAVELLIQKGAYKEAPSNMQSTPLHKACWSGHSEIAKLLIKHGAGFNATDNKGNTPLHLACFNGHYEAVELLIQKGADTEASDNEQRTPLHNACWNGHSEIAKLLIKHGAGLNATDNKGNTPLHLACFNGHYEAVELLIQKGADTEASDNEQLTPLHNACWNGHSEIAKLLIKHGAGLNATDNEGNIPLHLACFNGHYEAVELLIQKGADKEAPGSVQRTPLHKACWNGHSEIAKLLIDHGAGLNATDNKENTPLHLACFNGHYEAVELLIQKGADKEAPGNMQRTPLHNACENGHSKIAKLLIDHGAGLNATDNEENTPLHLACFNGHYEAVELLIQKGADKEAPGSVQRTPLHKACWNGHSEIAKLLIDHGAGLNATDNKENTPLHLACFNGHYEAVELLIQKGADKEAPGNMQRTPLHNACENGHSKIAKLLIDHGAGLNATDNEENTPLHLACFNGHYEAVELLIQKGADKEAPGNMQSTPLHKACWSGHSEIAKLLIKHGVGLNATDNKGNTPLHLACFNGHYKAVELLIQKGADTEASDNEQRTPLHNACWNGHSEIAKLLIKHGAGLNATDNEGNIPLHVACFNGHYEAVELLIQKGADTEASDNEQLTPLHNACWNGHSEIAKLLIKHGAGLNATDNEGNIPLHVACFNGHYEAVELLIQKGADKEAPGNMQRTPLHYACLNGHSEIAKLLIKHGAGLNATDNEGNIPLHLACFNGHYEAVELLIQKGADKEAPSNMQSTPLHKACWSGHSEIAKLLIKHGAGLNATDNNGNTPLHLACFNGHYEAVELLIQKGADTEASDNEQRTPLHYACLNGQTKIAKLLIDHGAGLNATDNEENTPLHVACFNGHYEAVELLIQKGADTEASDNEQRTPLHNACWNGHSEIAKLLIKHGAGLNATDNEGNIPLHLACFNGHYEAVELLIQKGADKEAPGNMQRTPLHYACLNGQTKIAKLLIDHGAGLNATDNDGDTPLHYACYGGHYETVRLLINERANLDAVNRNNKTPLQYACLKRGHLQIIKLFIENGAQLNGAVLLAIESGDYEVLELLIQNGAHIA